MKTFPIAVAAALVLCVAPAYAKAPSTPSTAPASVQHPNASSSSGDDQDQPNCPLNWRVDKNQDGIYYCTQDADGNQNTGGFGFTVSGKDLAHFIKYPLGTSNHSVVKDGARGVHHFAGEVGKVTKRWGL
jgi:hypothetical protein